MLSLRELRRAAHILRGVITGAVLKKVSPPGDAKLIFTFESSAGKVHLLISAHPEYARVCLGEPSGQTVSPNSFFEYLRAHLPGTSVESVDIPEGNRQIRFHLQRRGERASLILSIMGPRSNLYLLDAEDKLAHTMRSLEDTRRELKVGDPWKEPEGAAPAEGLDRWAAVPDARYLGAVAQAYDLLEKKGRAELLARRIEQGLKKERTFLDRKAVNLQEDLGEAKKAELYRHFGELLKNVLHTVRPGAEKVRAIDYQSGEKVDIPLDPQLSPAANLEAYFARYQKVSRGVKMIEDQLEELEAARRELDSMAEQVRQASHGAIPDIQALEDLISQPRVRRVMQRLPSRQKPSAVSPRPASHKREIPSRLLPKRYRTQDGLEIWVGRNDEGNDYLTTRLARGNDLFFHLEGYPGSHVVLRTEGRLDPPPKSLLDACELAVHFSKLKNAGNADVHMAHIKDVKKPKGAKPGLVYVRSGKTIHLRRDAKRLQNILSSRLDQ